MKVMLVDDERNAVEHLKSLISWQDHGFEVAATASNGKSALRLCEEHRPQIMIVDIRMPVMDGLELIRSVSEKQFGVKFIVMSAYKDFGYAQQAIALGGVSSYLIKHTVDRDKLLEELFKAKRAWESDEANRRFLNNQQIKNSVTGTAARSITAVSEYKGPFALLLVQFDVPFTTGLPNQVHPDPHYLHSWTAEETVISSESQGWHFVGEFMVSETQRAVLLSSKSKSSSLMRDSLRELARLIQTHFHRNHKRTSSIFYAIHTGDADSLPQSFSKTKKAALHAVFCGQQALVCADDAPLPGDQHPPVLNRAAHLNDLISGLEQKETTIIESVIASRFESLRQPVWDLRGLIDLIDALYKLLNGLRMKWGLHEIDPLGTSGPVYNVHDIRDVFIDLFCKFLDTSDDTRRVSHKLSKALQYIHSHFQENISIDEVAYAAGISSSYLHLLFKRDLTCTFLAYVTEYRIHQAKRILQQEDVKISEVAAKVGYRSTQHFSQVFKKVTGTLPHQYKEEGYSI
jgi:two-component system response regulator YesN